MKHVIVFCSVLQCVAVRCSVLQCVAVCCSVMQCVAVQHREMRLTRMLVRVEVWCSMLHCLRLALLTCVTVSFTNMKQKLARFSRLRRIWWLTSPWFSDDLVSSRNLIFRWLSKLLTERSPWKLIVRGLSTSWSSWKCDGRPLSSWFSDDSVSSWNFQTYWAFVHTNFVVNCSVEYLPSA